MSATNFIVKRNEIVQHYLKESLVNNDDNLYGQYTIVSANLSNYLPNLDPDKHMELFVNLMIHKKVSKLEQTDMTGLQYLQAEGFWDDASNLLRNQPSIICTFHTGSYRMLNLFLAKMQIPFTLVVGNSIMQEEGNDYISIYNDAIGHKNIEGLKIIDAESPKSALLMLRELKRGRSLVLYLDGNTGAGVATSKNNNQCLVNFLHQQLFARKGIAFLAHVANVPIIPVINYRKSWNDVRLKFHPPMAPDQNIDRERFAMETTQHLYDLVSEVVRSYPEQWEAWLYLHKVANIINKRTSPQGQSNGSFLKFDLSRFGVFKINKNSFLFQKDTYTSFPINHSLFRQLKKNIKNPINPADIKKEYLEELCENGVLIYL